MKRSAAPNSTATPSPPPPTIDAPAILARARVIMYQLNSDPLKARQIDKAAADAITHGRYSQAGEKFAATVVASIGKDPDQPTVDRAIEGELFGGCR